jgi:signal transduction histidine kinase
VAMRWGAGGRSAGHERLPRSAAWSRISTSAAVATLVAVTVGVCLDLPTRRPAGNAVVVTALLVAVAGVGWVLANRSATDRQVLAALTVTGLAGVLLALLPGSPGLVIVYLALLGLGMRVSSVPAFVAAFVVIAATNLQFLLVGVRSVPGLVSLDIGAAFIFAVGVFIRSGRISQERSRAAQARAEHLLAELRASQAAQAEAAALTERTRLAREIHDILAHSLSGLVLALDTMELLGRRGNADSGTMAKIAEQVARAQRIARDGLADTRRAIAALRGDELPGPTLLDRLVRETAAATGIRATLTVTGEQRPLPPEIGLTLYRTAQEALINTAKYAGRDGRAELRLSYRENDVELLVEDARPDDAVPPSSAGLTFGGYGLTGMRERAELAGGTLAAGPTDKGFRVLLSLPAGPAEATGAT